MINYIDGTLYVHVQDVIKFLYVNREVLIGGGMCLLILIGLYFHTKEGGVKYEKLEKKD